MNWDAYDEAYAAAPFASPPDVRSTSYLTPPQNCTFGCVPLKRTNASTVQRIAGTLPWRGKCFTAGGEMEMVTEPTTSDGNVSSTPVPLIARVVNRIDEDMLPPAPATATNATSRVTKKNETSSAASERRLAPAVVYEGTSAFDGKPALIIDYHGQKEFNTFRDEMRYVGCGVWLGKTYLAGPPSTLPRSLASVAGANVNLLNPLMVTLITKAMPEVDPNGPLPLVLDFVLFQTAPPDADAMDKETR